jgi:hypothetical protein
MTWLAHLYVAGRVLDLQAPRWPDMEFSIQRQGVDHLFDTGGLPTTLAECKSKLKKANGFNTSNGRYRANRARYFRNPRVLGNILAGQMDDSTQQESIYHVLSGVSYVTRPTKPSSSVSAMFLQAQPRVTHHSSYIFSLGTPLYCRIWVLTGFLLISWTFILTGCLSHDTVTSLLARYVSTCVAKLIVLLPKTTPTSSDSHSG